MIRFTFRRNLAFFENGIRWTLERQLATGEYQFISDFGEIRNVHPAEVHDKWATSKWLADESSLATLASSAYLVTPRDLGTYTDHQQTIALRRHGYLKAIDPSKTPYNPSVWSQLIAEHALNTGDPKPPCPSSVQNWWRKYRETKSVTALVPHKKQARVPDSDKRYMLFQEAVSEIYLTPEQLSKIKVFERVERYVKATNSTLPAEAQLKCPARSTIYRWLDGLRHDIVDAARLGAEAARAKYRMSLRSLRVGGILQRVEIDHTPLDLIILDSETNLPMGRPWLTLAIDKASRMILGFYLSFSTPSANSVLQCIKRSILPKGPWLARFPEVKGTWPAHGIFDLIALDNGMDFHSSALEKTCTEMGIEMLYCGARTPQHKGSIERFFRTMNDGLIHHLPGTTFSNVNKRGDYPAEKRAAITLANAELLITKWIVDVYHVRPHRTIGTTPMAKWAELAPKRIIELPLYPQQLEVITGIPATRTLFHYGIELEGMYYNSRPLQELRRRSGDNKTVSLKFYEDAISHIHVYDSDTQEYLQVPATDELYAQSLNRAAHRLIREHTRKQYGDSYSKDQLHEAREDIERIIKQSLTDKKMANRKRARKYSQPDDLASRQNSEERSKDFKPSASPPGLDDVLPELKFFQNGGERGAK